jgi:predicted ATPase
LPRDDRKIKKIKLEREKKEAYQYFLRAGKVYEKYARNNDAAMAYFKA